MEKQKNEIYSNRTEAGKYLARKLDRYKGREDLLVLGLPRGGVPVAFEVAQYLEAPLDVFLVRKLGVPIYEELAMGAIATGGIRVLNEEVIQRLGITQKMIEAVSESERRELERRSYQYRGDRPLPEFAGKTVILVDDGLATGASMRAAVQALKTRGPRAIVVAVPIAAEESCRQLEPEVDEVVCGRTPEPFNAVGRWYADFTQTTDEEVQELLNRAAHQRRAREIQKQRGYEAPCQEDAASAVFRE